MFRVSICAVAVGVLCAYPAARADAQVDAQNVQQRVDRLVAQLASPSAQQRLGAEVLLCSMGADGFPLIEAASRRTDLKPDVAAALAEIVGRERPRYLPRLCRQKVHEATWRWNQRTALAAYDKAGHRNPKWDELARAGIKQFVAPGGVAASRDTLEKAIQAGCDDPLILYLESRCASLAGDSDPTALERLFRTAAESMLKSNYPADRKFNALKEYVAFVTAKMRMPGGTPPGGNIALEASGAYLKGVFDLWPQVVQEPGIPEEFLDRDVATLLDIVNNEDGNLSIFKQLYAPLKEALPNSPFPLVFEGKFYVKYAWVARGGDYANKVSPEAWKLMADRLATAEADLTKAWEMDPTDPAAAAEMITVELGQGRGRDRMELWYQRAMHADPDNQAAVDAKMLYLNPKWYGSPEEMLAFGRELRDSKNYVGRLGNHLIEAHRDLAELTNDPQAYFRGPQVWKDIHSVFVPYLAAWPDDPVVLNSYAFNACRSARWAEAKRAFETLGDRVDARQFGGRPALDNYRRLALTNSAGDAP